MSLRIFLLSCLIFAVPASAKDRRELVRDAKGLIEDAIDTNNESDSDCQEALEHRLQKLLRLTKDAQRGSPPAIRRALDRVRDFADSAEDNCPGRNTREVLVSVNKAIRKLNRALHPDDDDEDEGDAEAPPPPPPMAAPPQVSQPAIETGPLLVNPNQYDGSNYAQLDVSGLHLRGMAGHEVVLSVAVKTFSGSWNQRIALTPVRCDYDDCGWDQPVSFFYPEDVLRGQNYDDGRFVALLAASDASTGQPLASRELDFRYAFPPMVSDSFEPVEPPPAVISVDIEPAVGQPPPIEVEWAPPPMLVEAPPPAPALGWFWVGGYWAWQGEWVWVHGQWRQPPSYGYTWCQPYYENRNGWVVFIPGHWQQPGTFFVPPAPSAYIARVELRPGAVRGVHPMGPPGVFVPPPPGSRPGVIVSAPIGTPPAVVTSAPPVVRPGMRIQGNFAPGVPLAHAAVTVVAPAGVTASGRPVQASVPAAPHVAAAMTPVVRVVAPPPATQRALPAFVPGRPPPQLPQARPAQVVKASPPARVAPPGRPGQFAPMARPGMPTPAPHAGPASAARPVQPAVPVAPPARNGGPPSRQAESPRHEAPPAFHTASPVKSEASAAQHGAPPAPSKKE